MRITRISRETHPEEFALLDRMDECRKRGHGKPVRHIEGVVECSECGECMSECDPDIGAWRWLAN